MSSATRLASATGTFTATGSKTNPTANSFYFDTHDLVAKEKLTMTAGTLPTTTSGPVEPDYFSLTNSTLKIVYDKVKDGIDVVKAAMGSESGQLLMNGYGHYYPFRNTVYTFDGGSQRIYWYHQTYRIDNYPNSQVTCPNLSTQGSFATGNPYDPFASNSTYGGKGYYIIQTPYEANTQIPYHINIWQVPPAVDTGGTRTRFYRNSGGAYNYLSRWYIW